MVTVLRPLSTSELLDRTFHLYRNQFVVFVGIAAIPQLVVLALQLALSGLILGRALTGMSAAIFLGAVTALVIGLTSFVAVEVSAAATIMAVSHLHLDRPTSIGSAYAAARGSMSRVIGISLGVGICVGLGLLLLIVPGIYLALAWSLAIPVTVLEGGGFGASTNRSSALTKGSKGQIFVIYFLIGVIAWIASALIQLVALVPIRLLGLQDPIAVVALTHALQSAAGFISASLVGPLGTIAITLIYYDQRVRKEGFDLQLMMSTLEGTAPVAADSPAPASGGI